MKTYCQFITEAKRRIAFQTVYHGTSPESAEKIKASGFKGDEVHASTDPDIAKGFGARYSKNPTTVRMRIVRSSIKPQPEKGAKVVKTQGQRGVNNWGTKQFSVAMEPEYASKRVSPPTGIIVKPKIPKSVADRFYKDRKSIWPEPKRKK